MDATSTKPKMGRPPAAEKKAMEVSIEGDDQSPPERPDQKAFGRVDLKIIDPRKGHPPVPPHGFDEPV